VIHFEGATADAVWRQAADRLRRDGRLQESRDQPTRELLHTAFTITDPRQRLVFARPINPAFALAEVLWIMAGANDAAFLRFWNPRMARFADARDARVLPGAYGFRLGSQPQLGDGVGTQLRHEEVGAPPRLDQIRAACEALRHTPHSRQVVLQIWDSRHDLPNPEPRSRDVPCNVMSHLMIRDGRLEWLQVMRSNDLIWGVPYNFVQFTTMQEIIAGWLGVDVGTYTHVSDSLHVYERHWATLEQVAFGNSAPRNAADLRIASYDEWETVWARLIDGALALSQRTDADGLKEILNQVGDVPWPYAEWTAVLTAEALRRRKHEVEAAHAIQRAGAYWGASWQQWHDTRRRLDGAAS